MAFLESRWGFLLMIVFPISVIFLYEIYAVVKEITRPDEEEKVKVIVKEVPAGGKPAEDDEVEEKATVQKTEEMEEKKESSVEVKEESKEEKEMEEKTEETEETEKEEKVAEVNEIEKEEKESAE